MIIITGACGFIGSRILSGLFEAGCNERVILVDHLSDENVKKISKFPIYDFLTPAQFLKKSKVITADASCVFHQGAITNTTHPDISEIMELNYRYTKMLVSSCILNKTKIVCASSAAVYGNGDAGFKEHADCESPLNVYGFTKLLADNWIRQNDFFSNYEVFSLRYFNVYGMGEEHKGDMSSPILKFFKNANHHERQINIFEGSDNFFRDFVAVEDVVKVNLQCAFDDITPGVYNVGSGKKISFSDVAKITQGYFSDKELAICEIKFPEKLKGRYQRSTHANLINLRAAGYKEKMIEPEVGIKKYLLDLEQAKENEKSIY